jgi:hypothetical protein
MKFKVFDTDTKKILDGCDGLAYIRSDGKIFLNQPTGQGEDLRELDTDKYLVSIQFDSNDRILINGSKNIKRREK